MKMAFTTTATEKVMKEQLKIHFHISIFIHSLLTGRQLKAGRRSLQHRFGLANGHMMGIIT